MSQVQMSPTESQYQFLTILEEKSSQKMSNTQMGTTFSCPNKRLIIAISDDDPKQMGGGLRLWTMSDWQKDA